MFEVGSRLEYDTNSEVRLPYLGSTNTNLATITYANDPGSRYLFGGNPVVTDTRYLPITQKPCTSITIPSTMPMLMAPLVILASARSGILYWNSTFKSGLPFL